MDKRQLVAHVWYPVLGRRLMEVPQSTARPE